jgi:RNA polymerase sigma-70 factor (ECF subfamily)
MQAAIGVRTNDELLDDLVVDEIPVLVPHLYTFARLRLSASDAEDAVGAALEHVWRNRRKLPSTAPDSVERWLMRVAVNRIRDEVRRSRRRPDESYLSDLELPDQTEPPEAKKRMAEAVRLRASLARLSENDAELISLRFGAGLSNAEIAEHRRMNSGAVAVAMHRALSRLRHEMLREE